MGKSHFRKWEETFCERESFKEEEGNRKKAKRGISFKEKKTISGNRQRHFWYLKEPFQERKKAERKDFRKNRYSKDKEKYVREV